MSRRGYGVLLVAGAVLALDVAWAIAFPHVVRWLVEHRNPDTDDMFWWIGVIDLVLEVGMGGALALGMALVARSSRLVRRRAILGSVFAAGTVLFVGLRMVVPYILENPYTEGSLTDWVYRASTVMVVLLHGGALVMAALTLRAHASELEGTRIKSVATAMAMLVAIGLAMPLWRTFVERVDGSWGFGVDRVAVAVLFLVVVALMRRVEGS